MIMGIRIGLIGCGIIVNQYYLPSLTKLQEEGKVELVACCDLNREKAEKAAEKASWELYPTVQEISRIRISLQSKSSLACSTLSKA